MNIRDLGIESFTPDPLTGEPPAYVVALARLFFELGTLAVNHGADALAVTRIFGEAAAQLQVIPRIGEGSPPRSPA